MIHLDISVSVSLLMALQREGFQIRYLSGHFEEVRVPTRARTATVCLQLLQRISNIDVNFFFFLHFIILFFFFSKVFSLRQQPLVLFMWTVSRLKSNSNE